MRTGLNKRQKTTEIFFDETKSRITVYTHNTDLKKRMTAFAEQYPDYCTMTDEDTETGRKEFEIEKGRLSFRLTAPYSKERRQQASLKSRGSGFGSKAWKDSDISHSEPKISAPDSKL